MAASSSGPSVSMLMVAPFAAASIITPMMLLALTRLPLRATQISLVNWPASWVSLADARAWRPSLLMISASRCSIVQFEHRHADHAFAAAADRLGHYGLQIAVAVREHADQHRQADAGHRLDFAGHHELGGEVAGRAAVHVGQNQQARAVIEFLDQRARLREQQRRVVLRGDAELFEARRALVQDMTRAMNQAFAQRAMGDDQDAYH